MNEILDSAFFWVGLAVFVVTVGLIIDFLMRGLANRRSAVESPHRVANQLPRTLHKQGYDEVLDLKDDTELQKR